MAEDKSSKIEVVSEATVRDCEIVELRDPVTKSALVKCPGTENLRAIIPVNAPNYKKGDKAKIKLVFSKGKPIKGYLIPA